MLGHGLAKDDVVVAQLPNTVDAVLLFLACARIGLILSPVAMPYRAHELGFILDSATPKAIVTLGSFAGFDHAALMRELAAPRGIKVLVLGDGNATCAQMPRLPIRRSQQIMLRSIRSRAARC